MTISRLKRFRQIRAHHFTLRLPTEEVAVHDAIDRAMVVKMGDRVFTYSPDEKQVAQ